MKIDETITQALADVRDDAKSTNWIVAGHQTLDPEVLSFVASGSGGFDEMVASFDSTKVQYALLRVTIKVDLSEVIKFVYFYLLGEEVPMMKKGRLGICKGEVQSKFQQYHVDFNINKPNEVTLEDTMNKVRDAAGTLDKSHDTSFLVGKQERGYSTRSNYVEDSSKLTNISKSITKLNESMGSKTKLSSSEGLNIEFTDTLKNAIKSVRDDYSSIKWVVAGYQENNVAKPIDLIKTGTEGVEEMKECFLPELIAYALIRVNDKIDGLDTTKFVMITHIGEKVGIMQKAKIGTHKGSINDAFNQFHVDFTITEKKEISDIIVSQKVAQTSGSKGR